MSQRGSSRWAGAGYRSSTALALVGGIGDATEELEVIEEPEEPKDDPQLPPPPPPSVVDQWKVAAPNLDADGRRELPGRRRRALRAVTFGAYKGLESKEEWRHRRAEARALAPLPADVGVGTVVVAQPKGGVGKSATAVLAACALGQFTRLSPILWDCNENAGGRWQLRTEDTLFLRTALHLLTEPRRGTVLSQVEATAIDQDTQAYQVIASPIPPRPFTDGEFGTIYSKLAQRFTQIVIDTGSTVTSPNFENAIRRADVVVVPTDLAPSTQSSTLALFEALEDQWGKDWARKVVAVVTNPVPDPDLEWENFLSEKVTEVVKVPYDEHIAARGPITWSGMSEGTHESCLHLAGAITDIYRQNTNRGN